MGVYVTVVCSRPPKPDGSPVCAGGGWWGSNPPGRCPRCNHPTTVRGRTDVTALR